MTAAPEPDLLDALLAPARWDNRRCTIAQALEDIPDEKARAKVAAAADNPLVSNANIGRAFKHLIGTAPGESSIKRHRARTCNCP